MANVELGMFEDDPRSVAGAHAIELLEAQTNHVQKTSRDDNEATKDLSIGYDLWDSDPRIVATRAAVKDERSFEAYRHREAWVMQPGVEVNLSHSAQ